MDFRADLLTRAGRLAGGFRFAVLVPVADLDPRLCLSRSVKSRTLDPLKSGASSSGSTFAFLPALVVVHAEPPGRPVGLRDGLLGCADGSQRVCIAVADHEPHAQGVLHRPAHPGHEGPVVDGRATAQFQSLKDLTAESVT